MYVRNSFPLFRSLFTRTTATWPLPSNEGCRPPYTTSKAFRSAYELGGNTRGDPWCGRPARYVRKTPLGHMSPTYAPHTPDVSYSFTMPAAATIDPTTVDASLIVDSHKYHDHLSTSSARHDRQTLPPATATTTTRCDCDHTSSINLTE